MTLSKLTAVACALVVLGLVTGGCGNSDDDAEGVEASEASAGQTGSGNSGGGGGSDGGGGGEGGGASSGSGPTADTERLTAKGKFAAEADEICTEGNKGIILRVQYYVQKNKDKRSSLALQAEAVDLIFIPNLKKQVEAIRELELPGGGEDQAESFITAMEEGIETTEDNTYTAANVDELGSEFQEAARLAQGFFGISGCGYGA